MTPEAEKQKKIDSIEINLDGDTELPHLNQETLDEFGFEDKPVLLKKNVIEKNMNNHPEVDPSNIKILSEMRYINPTRFCMAEALSRIITLFQG